MVFYAFTLLHPEFEDPVYSILFFKGEVLGLIRKEVIDDYGEELRPGTALILKDLVIYTPKNAPPFVNIAKKTIASMYCNDPTGLSARGEPIAKLSKEEVKKLQAQADKVCSIIRNYFGLTFLGFSSFSKRTPFLSNI